MEICTPVTRCPEVSGERPLIKHPIRRDDPVGRLLRAATLSITPVSTPRRYPVQTWRCHVFFELRPCRPHLCQQRKGATVRRNSRTLGFAETSLSGKAGACPSRARYGSSNVQPAELTAASISETHPLKPECLPLTPGHARLSLQQPTHRFLYPQERKPSQTERWPYESVA